MSTQEIIITVEQSISEVVLEAEQPAAPGVVVDTQQSIINVIVEQMGIAGPQGPAGPPGPPGLSSDEEAASVPDLVLIFENQLI